MLKIVLLNISSKGRKIPNNVEDSRTYSISVELLFE
jgi:hypothetical protein